MGTRMGNDRQESGAEGEKSQPALIVCKFIIPATRLAHVLPKRERDELFCLKAFQKGTQW